MDKHGPAGPSVNGYVNKKCRCSDCQREWADYCRIRRQEKKDETVDPGVRSGVSRGK